MKIKIAQLAALAECMEGVNLRRVDYYRKKLQSGETEPIKVWGINPQGFYVLSDGHHRTLAYALEGRDQIPAQIDAAKGSCLSWRWPRIAPVAHTLELINLAKN